MKEFGDVKRLIAIVVWEGIDEVGVKSQQIYSPCVSGAVFVTVSRGDQSLLLVPVLLGTGALLLSSISRWLRGWFKGMFLTDTSFLRPMIHFRPATTMKVIYGVVTGGHSFYLWVSEVEWNPPNLNNRQRGWPYREPAEENIWSHCSNEWTAINLKQTTLFLLLSVGNEKMKRTHKLSKRQH